jgi:hypothetical protein
MSVSVRLRVVRGTIADEMSSPGKMDDGINLLKCFTKRWGGLSRFEIQR